MVNKFGVVINTIKVLEYKDKYLNYSIEKGVIDKKEYFSSSVTAKGFGIYSGASGPVSKYDKRSYNECLDYIKIFLKKEFQYSKEALKHLNKLEIYKEQGQLKLF